MAASFPQSARSRKAWLPISLACLIIGAGVAHAGICAYILFFSFEVPGASPDAGHSLPALSLQGLDITTVRWLVAGSAAQALALALVPYLLRQGRLAQPAAEHAWSSRRSDAGHAYDDLSWVPALPLPVDRPGVIAVRLANLDAIVNVHGRAVAHRLLRAAARTLRENARKSDIVTRTDHDRFAVVLSDTDPASLSATAARLRSALGRLEVSAPGGQAVTVDARLGWSSGEGHDLSALLDLAHADLHDALEQGPAVPG